MPLILNRLAEAGLLHADALTVTGRTIGEEAAAARGGPGQEVVRPLADPLKPEGGLAILRGNLAPEGAVVKLAGTERTGQTGPARVFESEEECFRAVKDQAIEPGDVVVIRNEGPAGGPGMREMLQVTAAIVGEGLGEEVALLTDGRFSGRHPRADGRPRRPRGGQGRADRGASRRRRGDDRRRGPPARRGALRRGDRPADRRVRAARAGLPHRRDGQVRGRVSSASEGAVTSWPTPPRKGGRPPAGG